MDIRPSALPQPPQAHQSAPAPEQYMIRRKDRWVAIKVLVPTMIPVAALQPGQVPMAPPPGDPRVYVLAQPGQWVVQNAAGQNIVLSDATMEATYEVVDDSRNNDFQFSTAGFGGSV